MDYILSCAIHSQESFCSSNVYIYFGPRTGQLYTYHLQNNYRVQLASQKNHVLQFNLRSAVFSYACIVWADWGGNYETWFSLELDETSGRDLPNIPTGLTSLGHLLTLLKLARSVISTYFAYLLPSTLEQLRDNKGKDKTHIKRISL